MLVRTCAQCRKPLKIPPALVGKSVRCPGCGHVQVVAPLATPVLTQTQPPAPQSVLTTSPTVTEAAGNRPLPEEGFDFLTPPQAADELGRLGPYRVLRVLGRGGMGVVFLAEDPLLRRQLALKVMLPGVASQPTARQRFLREAQAAAAVEHDHIIPVHQVGEDRGVLYVAMPLLKGESLDERLKRERRLPAAEVIRIGRETALGLAAAHERGLVHRDIKPANLWLEAPSGRVKILDFGLARPVVTSEQLTQEGAFVGTPAYTAPEQAQGQPVDGRADLFSLGCVLYRAGTGELPFPGPDAMAILVAIALEAPRPPRQVNPEVPAGLSDLILLLLAKDPAARPPSAQAVADALADLAGGAAAGPPSATALLTTPPRTPRAPRRRRLALLGAAGGLLVLAALALVAVFSFQQDVVSPGDGRPADGGHNAPPPGLATPAGEPLSTTALVLAPAPLDGVRSWTLETRGPRRNVSALAFPPVKGPVASGSGDGTLRLFDPDTGDFLRALLGHGGTITALAWSPDGRGLATGSADRTVRIWDVPAGRARHTLTGLPGGVRGLSWSPDGKALAAAVPGHSVWLWNPATGQPLPKLEDPDQDLVAVAFSPKGRLLATGWNQNTRVWDITTGKVVHTVPLVPWTLPLWCPWSPDGRSLVIREEGGRAKIWDLEAGKATREWDAHGWHTYGAAWSPDGQWFATQGHDNMVRVWDSMGNKVQEWGDFGYSLPRLAWSFDGKRLARGTHHMNDHIECHDPASGKQLWRAPGHASGAHPAALSPDGKTLADARYGEPTVRLWDLATGQISAAWEGRGIEPLSMAWSPDGTYLAASHSHSPGASVRLWDAIIRRPVRVLDFQGWVMQFTWSPDGKRLAAAAEDGRAAYVFEAATGNRVARLEGGGPIVLLCWSADGKAVAGSQDWARAEPNAVRVWDVASGQLRKFEGHKAAVRVTAFAPKENVLASGGSDGTVRLWDVASGKPRGLPFEGHTGPVVALSWSPDGRRLASGSEDESVFVWSVDDDARPMILGEHGGPVEIIAWSPDGGRLAVLAGRSVRLWEATGKLLHTWQADRADVCTLHWTNDGKTLLSGRGNGATVLWDAITGRPLASLLGLRNGLGIALGPDGHYKGPPGIERELTYVAQTDQGQETLSPAEFAARFGWNNDPGRVGLPAR